MHKGRKVEPETLRVLLYASCNEDDGGGEQTQKQNDASRRISTSGDPEKSVCAQRSIRRRVVMYVPDRPKVEITSGPCENSRKSGKASNTCTTWKTTLRTVICWAVNHQNQYYPVLQIVSKVSQKHFYFDFLFFNFKMDSHYGQRVDKIRYRQYWQGWSLFWFLPTEMKIVEVSNTCTCLDPSRYWDSIHEQVSRFFKIPF